ncbi:spermine oxidase-like isoform X3 [Homarus americanus]|uniref:spermine oxidase-like isoform X3 n=1 Tax=Homarus americanus TaxID=6706 RepID=UPI001C45C044|nr:spermine oxidase-like isoform X3 [Homarus americanus]
MVSIPHKVRVCIVGAGVSGLGAAQRLIKCGIVDLVILEAQDRVGGRVHTVEYGEHHLEMGAQWIHGEEGNVVYDFASENDLIDDELSLIQTGTGNTIFVRHNGEIVPEEVQEEFSLVTANLSESSEKDFHTYPHSSGQYFTEKFKTENKWGTLGEELLNWYGRFQNCIDGSDSWFDISAKEQNNYKECPGNISVNWKQKGYKNLLLHLQETVPSSCLFLNSPVKSIDWGICTSASTSGCKVTLTSDQVIQADHIIFTPSLGFLKAMAKEVFNPPLPRTKVDAIQGLGFGVVDKVYIKFPHRWWDESCDGFSFLHDLKEVPDSITKENWEYGVLGFYEVFKHPDMMCGWLTGPAALMMEQTPKEEVAKRCAAMLRERLSHKFKVPDVIWCTSSSWGSNPWIKGSYSLCTMKTEAMGVKAADLAEPLIDSNNVPLVCFAGEATHDCYYSTVHGALETGWREADRLVKYLKSVPDSTEAQHIEAREKYDVIIIGAGAAGIGAARELTSQGVTSILILEGNDRIGGRVNTIKTARGFVDLGAQWIHGEDGNAIFQFANSRNLLDDKLSVDGRGVFVMENGRQIKENIIQEVLEIMEEADDDCKEYNHSKKLKGVDQISVGDVYRNFFFTYLKACDKDSLIVRRIKLALYYWTLRWQRIDNACDSLHQLSASCWGNYVFCSGKENMNPKAGFLSILEAILADTRTNLKLRSEVDSIDYASEVMAESGGYFRPDGTTYPVIIKCKDGSEFEAQHVIVTPSIGYLKSHSSLFSPALPTKLQKAITSMGYGTIDKIYLEYENCWWPSHWEGVQLVWTKDIPDFECEAPNTLRIDGSSEQMNQYWVRAISGFDPVFNQTSMLCGWIGGPEAEYMEGLSADEVGQACTKLLKLFLGWKHIPYPKKIYRSCWASDFFSRGSYSYHPVGCNCGAENSENDLNMPVCAVTKEGDKIPVLVLAGEANSRAYYSTVHGALQSGIAQTTHYVNSRKGSLGSHVTIKSKL